MTALERTLAESGAGASAIMVRTSGTTGAPRLVALSREALRAQARLSCERIGAGPHDPWLLALPPHHIAGIAVVARALECGAPLETHPRFEPEAVARALASGRIACTSLVARSLARTLDAMEALSLRGSPRLKAVLAGGGPTPEALLERARALGVPALRTYGLTEACATVACQAPGETGLSCGRPLDGVEVRIDVVGGAEGEILVRGPTVTIGRSGEAPLAPGAWLRTGDIGRIDALGRLHVLDRRTDLIATGGLKVVPAIVEAALEAHPAVLEACVVGVPDPTWGQRVVAVVVPRAGIELAGLDRELDRWVRDRVAPHEVPKALRIAQEALPRTDGGKLRRDQVRASWGTGEALDAKL